MRVIHAVRELNAQRPEQICVIALYTEAERDAMFVRHADEAVALSGGYLDLGDLERALARGARRRRVGRLGLRRRAPGVRRAVRAPGHRLRGSRRGGHAPRRRQDRRQAARRGGGRPRRALERRPRRDGGRGAAPRRAHRLPADDQGHRRRRRAGHPPRRRARRAPGRVRQRAGRGDPGVRRRHGAAGEAHHAGTPHRGADRRRRPRRRMGGRPARLLLSAPQPEGHRGVRQPGPDRRAGARGHGRRAAAGAARRLSQRRHGRVPLRARHGPLLVHGGQRAPPGRASRDRGRHRPRPRQAAARTSPPADGWRASRRRPAGMPSRRA